MGNVNAVPVVSQVKSAIQASCGDMEGALQTQEDFSKQCVVVSQVRSAVEATFDPEAACRTQLEFLDNLENVADATPIVGHVKGAVHYSLGDTEKGDGCMKSASRTAAMVVTGVVTGRSGLLTAGGASALVAEGVTTLIDSTIHNECRPSSIIKTDLAAARKLFGTEETLAAADGAESDRDDGNDDLHKREQSEAFVYFCVAMCALLHFEGRR